jgi:CRP-like cAMP-binding protein
MPVSANDQIETALANTELFQRLSPKALRMVAQRTKTVQHNAGAKITAKGRSGAGFHLVLEGTAAVETPTGDVMLGPGDYFGEISLIDGLPRTATVRAATDIVTAVIAPWDFGPLLREQPELAIGLLHGLCARLRAGADVPSPRIHI